MSIQPQRSKFKKCTATYFKDNLLDIIDISETLSKNRYIHKCPLNNFIYFNYLSNNNKLLKEYNNKENTQNIIFPDNQIINENNKTYSINSIEELNYDNINFEKLNQNKFHINFTKLKLEYENGYTILFIDKYFPLEIKGAGAFGLVLSVIDIETKMKLAVKIIDKKNINIQSELDDIAYQVKLLKKLNNPRIMKIFNVLETKKYIFIFMELIEGGNLKDLIINRYIDSSTPFLFRDSECSLIMKGILESLNYLHKNNIIHRDIKPENILFKKKNDLSSVVLCDFGLSYQFKEYEKYITDICGTTIYMAPEIFSRRGYDFLVDSFSAGIVLFELCSGGMHPFLEKGMKKNEYIQKILNFNGGYSFSKEMPLLSRNLFLKLCKYEPILRYGPYKALRHPWITRSNASPIPMTLLEEYNKSDKIVNFKALLATGIALIMIKNKYNIKPKIQEIETNFNETIFNKSSVKKKIKHKINNININNNFFKTTERFNYNILYGIQNNISQAIPLLRTSRPPKNFDKFIAKKLSKRRLFPNIEAKSSKNNRYKIREENDSKIDSKNSMEKNKGVKICLSKDYNNTNKNNNRNHTNSYLYLRTYSCNKKSNKKNSYNINNSKNNNEFSLSNNKNKIRISDKIFNNYGANLINPKRNEVDNYFLKDNNNANINIRFHEKRNIAPNLLSLNHRQREESYNINKINKDNIRYTPKSNKNVRIASLNLRKQKRNNKRLFLKDVLTDI